MKRIIGWLFAALGVAVALGWLGIITLAVLTPTPTFEQVRAETRGSESTLLARDGEPLQRLRVDMKRRQLEWTALDAISPELVQAIVAAEDKRFGGTSASIRSAAYPHLSISSATVEAAARARSRCS